MQFVCLCECVNVRTCSWKDNDMEHPNIIVNTGIEHPFEELFYALPNETEEKK